MTSPANSNRGLVLLGLGAVAVSGVAVLRWRALEKKRKAENAKAETKAASKGERISVSLVCSADRRSQEGCRHKRLPHRLRLEREIHVVRQQRSLQPSELSRCRHNQGAAFAGHEPAFWDQKEGRFIEPDIHCKLLSRRFCAPNIQRSLFARSRECCDEEAHLQPADGVRCTREAAPDQTETW